MAANSGDVTLKVLQDMMEHANFQTTMNTYAGLDTGQMPGSSRDLGKNTLKSHPKVAAILAVPEVPKSPVPQAFSGLWNVLF